jgi:hypothetical protein
MDFLNQSGAIHPFSESITFQSGDPRHRRSPVFVRFGVLHSLALIIIGIWLRRQTDTTLNS